MKNLFFTLLFIFYSTGQPLWLHSFVDAKVKAKEENKNILLYFSGSDWCKPCIQLKKLVLETEEFQNYVSDKYILVQADFPRLKKNQPDRDQVIQNELLAEKYNSEGIFPLLVILDNQGGLIQKIEYHNQSVDDFLDLLAPKNHSN